MKASTGTISANTVTATAGISALQFSTALKYVADVIKINQKELVETIKTIQKPQRELKDCWTCRAQYSHTSNRSRRILIGHQSDAT